MGSLVVVGGVGVGVCALGVRVVVEVCGGGRGVGLVWWDGGEGGVEEGVGLKNERVSGEEDGGRESGRGNGGGIPRVCGSWGVRRALLVVYYCWRGNACVSGLR